MTSLRQNVLAARERLADGYRQLAEKHEAGCSGGSLCAAISDLRDEVILSLFRDALEDCRNKTGVDLSEKVALVAHGGYGRRDVAPFSDVDLMILHEPSVAGGLAPLAEQVMREIFDAGLTLGHSVRTPEQAAALAVRDPVIATSLIESRRLCGSEGLFTRFFDGFKRQIRRQAQKLMTDALTERRKERAKFGETVFLLEPNIKRSPGGLRDLHLLRWIGFMRYGTAEAAELEKLDVLTPEDRLAIEAAGEFLLRLRNEMHFHADKGVDVLDRTEQLRIAEKFQYAGPDGMLPVEEFMRDYFRHSAHIHHLGEKFVAAARSKRRLTNIMTAVFGHNVERNVQVGPAGVMATTQGLEEARGNLTAIIRMADLANLYNKPIVPETWEAIRREAPNLPEKPSTEACRHFVSLLKHPARLAELLRDLHQAGVLERFVPAMAHARGLLQFNQYHKFTVDEHCIRAVDAAADFFHDRGPVGSEYRRIADRHLLHLALLLHDLGKGFEEDHSEVGLKIAEETASLLGLSVGETDILKFLVHRHLLMNLLAFRRDTNDEQLVVQFASEVGSPEIMRMLYVMTAADLTAVGPDVWDAWKAEILTDLHYRAMAHLAAEDSTSLIDADVEGKRNDLRKMAAGEKKSDWFSDQVESLPTAYLNAVAAEQAVDDLRMLSKLKHGAVSANVRYVPGTEMLDVTVGAHDETVPGVFHRLTGALSSLGLQILSAQINTLKGRLVLDRFNVVDPDFAGEPPGHRIEQIEKALIDSLQTDTERAPSFRKTWQAAKQPSAEETGVQDRVNVDNNTSDSYTIFDVFTRDRSGVLYEITRELFEMGMSVGFAKIGTHLDQVVDVFYVTDAAGQKIADAARLEEARQRLLGVVGK